MRLPTRPFVDQAEAYMFVAADKPKKHVALAETSVRPPSSYDNFGTKRIFASMRAWRRVIESPPNLRNAMWTSIVARDPFAAIIKARMKPA